MQLPFPLQTVGLSAGIPLQLGVWQYDPEYPEVQFTQTFGDEQIPRPEQTEVSFESIP